MANDAAVFGQMGNGMVRVSAKNVTFKRVLCEAVNELRELGVPLLGYVFNLADKKHGRIRQCEREECNREESCCYQKKLIGQKQLKCAESHSSSVAATNSRRRALREEIRNVSFFSK